MLVLPGARYRGGGAHFNRGVHGPHHTGFRPASRAATSSTAEVHATNRLAILIAARLTLVGHGRIRTSVRSRARDPLVHRAHGAGHHDAQVGPARCRRWPLRRVRDAHFLWALAATTAAVGSLARGGMRYYDFLPVALPVSVWLTRRFAPTARGHGTEAVIAAVHRESGRIDWRVAPIKLAATILTLACGGSVGKEGPLRPDRRGHHQSLRRLPPPHGRGSPAPGDLRHRRGIRRRVRHPRLGRPLRDRGALSRPDRVSGPLPLPGRRDHRAPRERGVPARPRAARGHRQRSVRRIW